MGFHPGIPSAHRILPVINVDIPGLTAGVTEVSHIPDISVSR